jgi:hypothetical protein
LFSATNFPATQDSAVDPETGEVYNPKLELPLVFESLRKLWSSEIAEAQRLQQTRLPEQLLQQQAAAKPVSRMVPVEDESSCGGTNASARGHCRGAVVSTSCQGLCVPCAMRMYHAVGYRRTALVYCFWFLFGKPCQG